MKTYTCTVVMTVVGYISIEADSFESAKKEFALMNDSGVDIDMIEDQCHNSELILEEIECNDQ